MVGCSVKGCKSHSERKIPGISFHSFPSNPEIKSKWVRSSGKLNWAPTKNSKICSMHFDDEAFIYKNKLVLLERNSVPIKNIHIKIPGPQVSTDQQLMEQENILISQPSTSQQNRASATKRSSDVLNEVQYNQKKKLNVVQFGSDKVMNKKTGEECRACLRKIDEDLCQELYRAWYTPWAVPGALIADDLAKLADIEISESDKYSKVICIECHNRLSDACSFIITVQKSDHILRQRVNNTASVKEPDISPWPKPILLNKSLNGDIDTNVEIEIKQEVLSDEENGLNNVEHDWEPSMEIKIEPEEIVAPVQSDIQLNGAYSLKDAETIHQNGSNNYFESFLDQAIKQEPGSGEEQETVPDLPLDCMLCLRPFNTVTGLKAHVIAKHSYGTVKRKTDDSTPPSPVKKENATVHVCATCRESFETRTDLMVHEASHSKHVCYVCDAKFNTFRQLSRHGARCRPPRTAAGNRTRPPARPYLPQTRKDSPAKKQNVKPVKKQPRNGPTTEEIKVEKFQEQLKNGCLTEEIKVEPVERLLENGPSNDGINVKPLEVQSVNEPSSKETKSAVVKNLINVPSNDIKVEPVEKQSEHGPLTEDMKTEPSVELHINPIIKIDTEDQLISPPLEPTACIFLQNLNINNEETSHSEMVTEAIEKNSSTILYSDPDASSQNSSSSDNLIHYTQVPIEPNLMTTQDKNSESSLKHKSEIENSSSNIQDERDSNPPQEIVRNTDEINAMKISLAINPLNEEDSLLDTKMDIDDTVSARSEVCEPTIVNVISELSDDNVTQ